MDTKSLGVDRYFGTFRVKRICDDAAIISMFELAQTEITPLKVLNLFIGAMFHFFVAVL